MTQPRGDFDCCKPIEPETKEIKENDDPVLRMAVRVFVLILTASVCVTLIGTVILLLIALARWAI